MLLPGGDTPPHAHHGPSPCQTRRDIPPQHSTHAQNRTPSQISQSDLCPAWPRITQAIRRNQGGQWKPRLPFVSHPCLVGVGGVWLGVCFPAVGWTGLGTGFPCHLPWPFPSFFPSGWDVSRAHVPRSPAQAPYLLIASGPLLSWMCCRLPPGPGLHPARVARYVCVAAKRRLHFHTHTHRSASLPSCALTVKDHVLFI